MKPDTTAYLFEEGGKLASSFLKMVLTKPSKIKPDETAEKASVATIEKPAATVTAIAEVKTDKPLPAISKKPMPVQPDEVKSAGTPIADEIAYRWECCCKHLGGASVLLREAYERAIGDDGIGPGTAEKVMEAMNEHSAMELDIEKMLSYPDAKPEAQKLLDATRKFRRAAWDCHITTGQGTVDDIEAAKLWNDILYQQTFENAKRYPGTECVKSGM